jgi:hypothetical protein
MIERPNVPQSFLDALVAGLAARLSLKFQPERLQVLKQEATEAYQVAAQTNFEDVPLRFSPNFSTLGS